MRDELINDILLYLPDWTTKPTHTTPQRHYARSFVDEETSKDFNERKHVNPDEVVQTYYRAKRFVQNYLHRDHLPENPVIYDYTCMWTAGLLEERYTFKTGEHSKLVDDAKEELKPYIRREVINLNPQRKPKHHTWEYYHDYIITDNDYEPQHKKRHGHIPAKGLRIHVEEKDNDKTLHVRVYYWEDD